MRKANLVLAATAFAASAASAQTLTPKEYMTTITAFDDILGDQLNSIRLQQPEPLGTAACYTLADTANVRASYLGNDIDLDLFRAMPMTDGKIRNVNNEDLPLAAHFSTVAAFTQTLPDSGVIPGMVAVGCYKTAPEAMAARDDLNLRRALDALIQLKVRLLPHVKP